MKFTVTAIKRLITADDIKSYRERFRRVGTYETYIPFRPDMKCPADILATLGKKQIDIFTFNATTKKFDFVKTAGIEGAVIHLLIVGSHFRRLYKSDEDEPFRLQAEQIIKNSAFSAQ
jgi:hypothetical protein